MRQNHLRIILIGAFAAFSPVAARAQGTEDSARLVRRVATTARLAADEYRLGVQGGRVVLAPEVEEARLFLGDARRVAAGLPLRVADSTAAELGRLIEQVEATGAPDSLDARVERLVGGLSRDLAVPLDEVPGETPSLARGAEIFAAACRSCHGAAGGGDGPAAAGLDPPPTKLADRALAGASPLDFYRRVTIGVAGTAMPAFESALPLEDRWSVALYASTLRLPPARGEVPAGWADFGRTAGLSDEAIRDSLGGDLALVAAVRTAAPLRDYRSVFSEVRRALDSSFALARQGRAEAARSAALGAYMTFEAVERELRVKNAGLVGRLETDFARARDQADHPETLAQVETDLLASLELAERSVGTTLRPLSMFVQSLVLLLREGLEAILVVGALLTFLTRVGARERRREIHLGVAAALGLSLLTAVAIETVFRLSPARQEALEAFTMVAATVMLFYVSYWLVSKIEVARWNQFVRSRMAGALSRRSALALASVAFLAVYREGFETVLFYKALALSGGGSGTALPIGAGIAVGGVALGAVYLALNRFGVRLPLRPFFAITSAFLYFMAFSFAGTAVAELQEGGFAPITPVLWAPRIPLLGIHPTLESLLVQGVLLGLAAVALTWTFVVAPRRAAAARPVTAPAASGRADQPAAERTETRQALAAERR